VTRAFRVISWSRSSRVRWWNQRDRAWWMRIQPDQCSMWPGGHGAAAAAMTRTVCRVIAVQRRTWDWSSPKSSLPNSKSSSTGQRSPAARISPGHRRWLALGDEAVATGQLTGPDVAADQQVMAPGGGAGPGPGVPPLALGPVPGRADLPAQVTAQHADRLGARAGHAPGEGDREVRRDPQDVRQGGVFEELAQLGAVAVHLIAAREVQHHAVGERIADDVDGQLALGPELQVRRQAHAQGPHRQQVADGAGGGAYRGGVTAAATATLVRKSDLSRAGGSSGRRVSAARSGVECGGWLAGCGQELAGFGVDGLDGDFVAEAFEAADVVAGLAAGVHALLVVVHAEVGVAGVGVGQQGVDDGEHGVAGGDQGLLLGHAPGQAPVLRAEE